MTHLVQILLPLRDNSGQPIDHAAFIAVRDELTERFSGVTGYLQAPAEGVWKDDPSGEVQHEEIVVMEVMVEDLDRAWWRDYRERLRKRFRQEELVVRALPMEDL